MLRTVIVLAALNVACGFTAMTAFQSLSPVLKLDQGSFASKRTLVAPIAVPARNYALEALQMACTTARTVETRQQACRRECMLLGKRANNGMTISFSHIRNHKRQNVNLHWKRMFWPEGNCLSLSAMAKAAGIDLRKHICSSVRKPAESSAESS